MPGRKLAKESAPIPRGRGSPLQPHGALWGVAADTSRDDEVDRLIVEALVHLGRIGTLVHSAGIDGAGASVLDLTSADWRRVLEVNVHTHVRRTPPAAATLTHTVDTDVARPTK